MAYHDPRPARSLRSLRGARTSACALCRLRLLSVVARSSPTTFWLTSLHNDMPTPHSEHIETGTDRPTAAAHTRSRTGVPPPRPCSDSEDERGGRGASLASSAGALDVDDDELDDGGVDDLDAVASFPYQLRAAQPQLLEALDDLYGGGQLLRVKAPDVQAPCALAARDRAHRRRGARAAPRRAARARGGRGDGRARRPRAAAAARPRRPRRPRRPSRRRWPRRLRVRRKRSRVPPDPPANGCARS